MNQQNDSASEITQEDQASTETSPITSTGTLTEHDLPEEYAEQGLTNIKLRIAFREHFACWGDKSFKLLSNPVKTEQREFILKRGVDIEKGLGIHIVNALLKVVKTQTKEGEEWIQAGSGDYYPGRYYGGTEYQDPPPEIQSSSAIEPPRRSGLEAQNDDSIWAGDEYINNKLVLDTPFVIQLWDKLIDNKLAHDSPPFSKFGTISGTAN
ncbi:hypothetical protein E4U58_007122 [Claviceps cyperi]|nr:hypothetical protein E4U58_007122 [Claviceps cyperi]